MLFESKAIGTSQGTLLQTPPNYTFNFDTFYFGNTGTVADTLTLYALEYNSSGAVTGTIALGLFAINPGETNSNTGFRIPESVPAGSYLTAICNSGNVVVTYSGDYVFYRD
ncbi:MAG: hypothetical protein ACYDAO_04490 [Thermoplasmataceae archaeon]